MRYRRNPRSQSGPLRFNATPMVDVFFLLTIFFMLVSRFSSAEQVRMQLPKPRESQAKVMKLPERIVINCRPTDTDDPTAPTVLYSVGPNPPEPLAQLSDRLAALKRESPNLAAVLRADRRLRYEDVRAVMRVIAANRIDMLNVAAHVSEGE